MGQIINSQFDALVFDLGRVVINFDFRRALDKLHGKTPYSTLELITRLKNVSLIYEFESGRLTSEQFFRQIKSTLQLDLKFEEFSSIWSDIFFERLILEESLFDSLKPHYRLILLSNTNPMHASFLKENFPVLKKFDHLVFSHEVGALKPAEAVYRAVQKMAGTKPSRLFYVDDILEYVEAARRLGWSAVQFTGKDQLLADMRSHGIFAEGRQG
jgi:putative hydrolase of the HAD superfamily